MRKANLCIAYGTTKFGMRFYCGEEEGLHCKFHVADKSGSSCKSYMATADGVDGGCRSAEAKRDLRYVIEQKEIKKAEIARARKTKK